MMDWHLIFFLQGVQISYTIWMAVNGDREILGHKKSIAQKNIDD
jgi:hypothetical protein